mgnify:FL=1
MLNNISQQESKTFIFTNEELPLYDTLLNEGQNENHKWTEVIQKTNNLLINDAAEIISGIIQQDSVNSIAYFQRAIIKSREIELLGNYNEISIIGNSSFDTEKDKQMAKWLSVMNDFSKALQLTSSFSIAYFNRGNVKCVLRDFNGALKDYETAIDINPNFAEAHFNSGFVLYYLNQKNIACDEFSKAGELGIPSSYAFIKKYCTNVTK